MNLNRHDLEQFIPNYFGIIGIYLTVNYLDKGNYLIDNWNIPYFQIIIFGTLFWWSASEKLESFYKQETTQNIGYIFLIRIYLFLIFTGVSLFTIVRILVKNDFQFTATNILAGILTGVIISGIDLKRTNFYKK